MMRHLKEDELYNDTAIGYPSDIDAMRGSGALPCICTRTGKLRFDIWLSESTTTSTKPFRHDRAPTFANSNKFAGLKFSHARNTETKPPQLRTYQIGYVHTCACLLCRQCLSKMHSLA